MDGQNLVSWARIFLKPEKEAQYPGFFPDDTKEMLRTPALNKVLYNSFVTGRA